MLSQGMISENQGTVNGHHHWKTTFVDWFMFA